MRAILTYHSLDDSGSPISVSPAGFRRQMDWLAREQVRVVPLTELLTLPEDATAAALTFDDGFRNLVTEAAPLLAERGWPATVFVVSGHVGTDNGWRGGRRRSPLLPLLDWDALGRLSENGWMVGCHSRHHPRLPSCTDAELDEELEGAAADVETSLGAKPAWFAYPYGAVDDRVAARTAASYRGAVTTELSPLDRDGDPIRLPRIDAWYLRHGLRRAGWGRPAFRRRLRWRRRLRTLREALR